MSCTATVHGSHDAYCNHKCTCPEARAAHRRYRKVLRLEHLHGQRRTVDATGTQRRLQALTAIGWSDTALGAQVGGTKDVIYLLRRQTRIHRRSADRITELYSRLCNTPGGNVKALRRAERNGWLEPKWWDDELIDDPTYLPSTDPKVHWSDVDPIAIERAKSGDAVRLTRAERIRAVVELHEQGANDCEIGRRLRLDAAQVWRDRTRPRQLVAV